jgi:hypothetical protein
MRDHICNGGWFGSLVAGSNNLAAAAVIAVPGLVQSRLAQSEYDATSRTGNSRRRG